MDPNLAQTSDRRIGRRPLLAGAAATAWAVPAVLYAQPAYAFACSYPEPCTGPGTNLQNGWITNTLSTNRPTLVSYGMPTDQTPYSGWSEAPTYAYSPIGGYTGRNETPGWKEGFTNYSTWAPPPATMGSTLSSVTGGTNTYTVSGLGSGGGITGYGSWSGATYGSYRYLFNGESSFYRYDNGNGDRPDDYCIHGYDLNTASYVRCEYSGSTRNTSLPWALTNHQLLWTVPVGCGHVYNWDFKVDARWGTGSDAQTISGGNGAYTRATTQITASWEYRNTAGTLLASGTQYYDTPYNATDRPANNTLLTPGSNKIYAGQNFAGGENGSVIKFVQAGQSGANAGGDLPATADGVVTLKIDIGHSRRSYLFTYNGARYYQRNDDVAVSIPRRRLCTVSPYFRGELSVSWVAAVLAVAGVLAWSGWAKRGADAETLRSMEALGVPRRLRTAGVARVLSWVEVVLALGLLVPVPAVSVAAGFGAVGLLSGYVLLVGRALRRRTGAACNCFGSVPVPVTRITLVRNVLLAVLAALGLVGSWAQGPATLAVLGFGWDDAGWLAITALIGVAGAALARSMERPDADVGPPPVATGDEEGEDYVREPIPEVSLFVDGTPVPVRALAATRPRLLVFFAPGCAACERAAPLVASWAGALLPLVETHVVLPEEVRASGLFADLGVRPLYEREAALSRALEVTGTPTAYLLGADGLIAGGPALGIGEIIELVQLTRQSLAAVTT